MQVTNVASPGAMQVTNVASPRAMQVTNVASSACAVSLLLTAMSLHNILHVSLRNQDTKHCVPRRPNLVQAQLSLVLYCFIKADLLAALCHVVINARMPLAARTTVLLG